LCGDISFHVLITSLHHHNSLMGMRFFLWWWTSWFWTQSVLKCKWFSLYLHSLWLSNYLRQYVCWTHWFCSFINYSLVTTLGEAYLDCSTIILFSSFPYADGGFGESKGVSSFNKGNQWLQIDLYNKSKVIGCYLSIRCC